MFYGKPKPLKSFGHVPNKSCYYPPILDEDPELAASYLSIEDSVEAFKKLSEAFKFENIYPVLEDSILHSAKNFQWFSTFFLNLTETKEENLELKLTPPIGLPEKARLAFQEPFHFYHKYPVATQVMSKSSDPISKYRILYIGKHFTLEEFRGGYPIWYNLSEMTVFENYNERLNARVKVTHKNGEFMYYISGASDKWYQICNVPIEMDYVINALIYRN